MKGSKTKQGEKEHLNKNLINFEKNLNAKLIK